jgi:hypothetical protein
MGGEINQMSAIPTIIAQIDAELAALRQARTLLTGDVVKAKRGRPKGTSQKEIAKKAPDKKKRNVTPEGRARIAAAVKKRWAAQKKTVNKA